LGGDATPGGSGRGMRGSSMRGGGSGGLTISGGSSVAFLFDVDAVSPFFGDELTISGGSFVDILLDVDVVSPFFGEYPAR
jgi:hypothetical protein